MLLSTKRILYSLETKTRNFVAKQTGMSWGTVDRIARGIVEPLTKYNKQIRNLYQRESYAVMRNTGFSSPQARRFSWYNPDSVREVTGLIQDKIAELAKGYVGQRAQREGLSWGELDAMDALEDAYENIKEGLQGSKKSYEDWAEYGL